MPDYNPAIAAQVQPPQAVQQPNLMQTLSQAAEIQRSQAQTSLAQVQALQQTRQYNALLAASQAYQHGSDPVGAYLGGGGNPEGASQLQNLFLQQKAAAATPGGLAPQAYEQLSGAQKNQAETANARAQLPGFPSFKSCTTERYGIPWWCRKFSGSRYQRRQLEGASTPIGRARFTGRHGADYGRL